jgi:hypothetical protein
MLIVYHADLHLLPQDGKTPLQLALDDRTRAAMQVA